MTDFPTPQTETPGSEKNEIEPESVALTPIPKKKRRSQANALQQYEELVGGRQAIIESLQVTSNLDKREQYFLELLCSPARAKDTLINIALDAGLTVAKALDLFRQSSFARAHAMAMGRLAEALPDLAEDVAAKSVDSMVMCPSCLGHKGKNTFCDLCGGRGVVFRESTIDHQKLMLETLGVLKKGGGVNVQVNQNVGNTVQAGNFFSKYVKESDSTAYDVDIDPAEIIEVPKDEQTG